MKPSNYLFDDWLLHTRRRDGDAHGYDYYEHEYGRECEHDRDYDVQHHVNEYDD